MIKFRNYSGLILLAIFSFANSVYTKTSDNTELTCKKLVNDQVEHIGLPYLDRFAAPFAIKADKALPVCLEELGIDPNNTYKKLLLAWVYLTKGDYQKSIKWAEESAHSGNSDAMAFLAVVTLNGLKNKDKANQWLIAALEKDNKYAKYLAHYFYSHGVLEASFDQTLEWVKESANTGLAQAQALYGWILFFNMREINEGLSWIKKAAKQNNVLAMYTLAQNYMSGSVVQKNENLAKQLYIKATKYGDSEIQWLLAQNYFLGQEGFNQDTKTAIRWYEQSAKTRYPDFSSALSTLQLARIYQKGKYADCEKFTFWLNQASEIVTNLSISDDKNLALNNINHLSTSGCYQQN